MFRLSVLAGVLGIALCGFSAVDGQDAKKAGGGKAKGQLPQNWSKLGLSEEQKQKIYTVQADHREKIESLERQISELKKKQMDEMTKLLTSAQKERLKEIVSEKIGAGEDAPKKPVESKKP